MRSAAGDELRCTDSRAHWVIRRAANTQAEFSVDASPVCGAADPPQSPSSVCTFECLLQPDGLSRAQARISETSLRMKSCRLWGDGGMYFEKGMHWSALCPYIGVSTYTRTLRSLLQWKLSFHRLASLLFLGDICQRSGGLGDLFLLVKVCWTLSCPRKDRQYSEEYRGLYLGIVLTLRRVRCVVFEGSTTPVSSTSSRLRA